MAGEVICDLCKLLFCGEILCDALDELGHQEEAVSVARVELGQVILYITSVAELRILLERGSGSGFHVDVNSDPGPALCILTYPQVGKIKLHKP